MVDTQWMDNGKRDVEKERRKGRKGGKEEGKREKWK